MRIILHIDASYAVHVNGKGRKSNVVSLGTRHLN